MEGVVELAEEVFHMPVCLAVPTGVAGLADIVRNPIYATGVGLLMYGWREELEHGGKSAARKSVLARMKNWISNNL